MLGYFIIDLAQKTINIKVNAPSKSVTVIIEQLKSDTGIKNIGYDSGVHLFPLKKSIVQHLIKLGFDSEPYSYNYAFGILDRGFVPLKIKEECMFLRRFQREALRYVKYHNGRALLALDPGLGKTPTSLAWIVEADVSPTLVICPATVKEQWRLEYEKFVNRGKVKVLYGFDSIEKLEGYDIVIVNYDILAHQIVKKKVKKNFKYSIEKKLYDFISSNFQYLIIDEVHYIKDMKGSAKAYRAVREISKHVSNIVALSGTPIENTPGEIFNIANILQPEAFPNRHYFLERYTNKEETGFGIKYKGSQLENELNRRLRETVMYRRTKAQSEIDLPLVQPSVVPLKLDKHCEYVGYRNELNALGRGLQKTNKFEKLLQKAYELKENYVFKFIDDMLLKKDKVIVFAWHKSTIANLQERYGDKMVKIDGSVPSEKRTDIKNEFVNNSKKKLFVGNIQSSGVGLDGLQEVCDTIIFIELTWKSTGIDQAIARLERMGAKREIIFVYYIIALNTIEEHLSKLIDKKRQIVDKTVDGKATEQFDLLEELIKLDSDGLLT